MNHVCALSPIAMLRALQIQFCMYQNWWQMFQRWISQNLGTQNQTHLHDLMCDLGEVTL